MTYAEQIEDEAGGAENIRAIVIGAEPWSSSVEEGSRPPVERNVLLTWQDARPALDYEADQGFGGVTTDAFYAWTDTLVLFMGEYDGSSWVDSVPRNPDPDIEYRPNGVGG